MKTTASSHPSAVPVVVRHGRRAGSAAVVALAALAMTPALTAAADTGRASRTYTTTAPATSAAGAPSATWAACTAAINTVTTNGTFMWSWLENGQLRTRTLGKIGYQPLTYSSVRLVELGDTWRAYSVDRAGRLRQMTFWGSEGGGVGVEQKTLSTRWGGIRVLAGGSNESWTTPRTYLYGVATDGTLRRYSVNSDAVSMPSHLKIVSRRAGTSIRSMGWSRTVTVGSGSTRQRADVLLANTTNGRLIEMTIGQTSGTVLKTVVLRSSTWGGFDAVATQSCSSRGRAVLVSRPSGSGAGYLDQNASDGDATDFSAPRAVMLPRGSHFPG